MIWLSFSYFFSFSSSLSYNCKNAILLKVFFLLLYQFKANVYIPRDVIMFLVSGQDTKREMLDRMRGTCRVGGVQRAFCVLQLTKYLSTVLSRETCGYFFVVIISGA